MKVFVVGADWDYANWLPNCKLVDSIKESDLVLFTGGEDVSPSLYKEPIGERTRTNPYRDKVESRVFMQAVEENKPILGICRGSQLCCVMSGGRLVQDQRNPSGIHDITTVEGDVIPMTSTHHQAQYPYDMPENEYKLLAYTEDYCGHHYDGTNKEIANKPFKEVEICYYPKTRALGIQGHPEYVVGNKAFKDTFDYLDTLISNLLTNTL